MLVLPSGNYAGQISDAVLGRVKDWLRAGGTLVTLAEATRWAAGSGVGLLDTNALLKDGRPDVPATTGAAPTAARASTSSASAPAATATPSTAKPNGTPSRRLPTAAARQPGQASKPEPLRTRDPRPEPR